MHQGKQCYHHILLSFLLFTGQTSIWKAWPRHAQEKKKKKKVIIVKNNYDDAVWLSERKMSCVLSIPRSLWCLITDDPGVAFNGLYIL